MSIVVGLKHNGKCWLGCDKQVTVGDVKSYLSGDHQKIFDVPERPGVMMGHVGYLRGINLLQTNNNYIDELSYIRKNIDYSHVVNIVPLAINHLFVEQGFVDSEEPTLNLKGDSILCIDDDMYEIGWDGSVMEVDLCSAIGSGKEMALGSLSSSNITEESSEEEVRNAIAAAIIAADISIGCGGGGIIMNNIDEEVYQF